LYQALNHPNFDPVAFSLFGKDIYWYGIMYLVAFAQFMLLGRLRLKKAHVAALGWTKEHIDDMLFYGVLGVVFGGRLGEVFFYNPAYYFSHPLEIFMVWKGGMSFHGGFIGVLVAMSIWARKAKMPLAHVYDFIAPMVPLGYAAGRLGNFINHELPGRAATLDIPWAMNWPGVPYPVHPSPIYQMLVDGILLFFIVWIFARKARPPLAVGALYVTLYGCARFCTEYFRTPDYEVHFAGITISAGQMLSLPMIVAGLILLWMAYHHQIKIGFKPEAQVENKKLKNKK
jgi:phosphatidylglycerol:prolipoprotein diacylglycerol transferase